MRNPHPYLVAWIGCRNLSTDLQRVLPDAGGWLDQDLELMLAFQAIDELEVECRRAEEARRRGAELLPRQP